MFDYSTEFLSALIAISNPADKLPFWQTIADNEKTSVHVRITFLQTFTAASIFLLIYWFNTPILHFLGVDVASFQIAGGIIVGYTGFNMLQYGVGNAVILSELEEEQPFARAKVRFRETIVPCVMPMLAGPGAMSTVILYSNFSEDTTQRVGGSIVILSVMAITFITLSCSRYLINVMGTIGMAMITRFFGFVLVVMATQMTVEGLGTLFPHWLEKTSPIDEKIIKVQKFLENRKNIENDTVKEQNNKKAEESGGE